MPANKKARAGAKGFSLVELMVSVAILLVVVVSLLSVYTQCLILNDMSAHRFVAAQDAQRVLEELKSRDYDSLAAYTPPALSNLLNQTVAVNLTGTGTSLTNAAVTITWNERKQTRNYTLYTQFASSD